LKNVERKRSDTHELVGEEEDRLQAELAVTEVKQVFQGRAPASNNRVSAPALRLPLPVFRQTRDSQEIQDHGVVITLGPVPPDKRHSDTPGQRLVHLALVFQLRVLGLDGLQLDGDLFTGDDVDTEVDVTERTGSDLFTDTVFGAYAEIHSHDCGR
jgi:hypothetical protein